MNITVVIAAYNEIGTISELTIRLMSALDGIEGAHWSLVYIIDGTDGTAEAARDFAAKRAEIKVIHNDQPSGLGVAFRSGFQMVSSDTDFVVTMDADLNHQPEEIGRLLLVAKETGADIVIGSRRVAHSSVEGMPVWKTVLSRSVNRIMHFVMGTKINDLTSGFRLYRASALKELKFENRGFAFLPELLIDAKAKNMKIVEEPIRFVFREAGESKMHFLSTSLSYLRLFAAKSTSRRRKNRADCSDDTNRCDTLTGDSQDVSQTVVSSQRNPCG